MVDREITKPASNLTGGQCVLIQRLDLLTDVAKSFRGPESLNDPVPPPQTRIL